jgi:hypothetical protein
MSSGIAPPGTGLRGRSRRRVTVEGPEDQYLLLLLWGGLVKFFGGNRNGMKEIKAEMGFWGKGDFWEEGRKWSVFRGMARMDYEGGSGRKIRPA